MTQSNTNVKLIRSVVRMVIIYAAFIFVHNLSTNIYVELCAKPTIKGFILSAFNVPAPHCTILRNFMDFGVNGIYSMWSIIFLWLTSEMARFIPETT
jgi:hypothetical protein